LREERRLRVFENRVPRILAGSKRHDVRENLRRLHNEEFHGFHSSPNITRLMKKNGTREACDTYRGEFRCMQENLRENGYLEGVDIDGSIKRILKKSFGRSDLG
jgi:hypothetical protein